MGLDLVCSFLTFGLTRYDLPQEVHETENEQDNDRDDDVEVQGERATLILRPVLNAV